MKRILVGLIILLGLPLAALLLVWLKPSLVIKPKVVRWALHKFAVDQHITFSDMQFHDRYTSFLGKDIDLRFQDLCMHRPSPTLSINACLDRAEVDFSFEIDASGFNLKSVKHAVVVASKPIVIVQASTPPAVPTEETQTTIIEDYQKFFDLGLELLNKPKPEIELNIAQATYTTGKTRIHGDIEIKNSAEDAIQLATNLQGLSGPRSALNLTGTWGTGAKLELDGQVVNVGVSHLDFDLVSTSNGIEGFDIHLRATDPNWKMFKSKSIAAVLHLTKRRVELSSKTNLNFVPGTSMIHIRNQGCGLAADLQADNAFEMNLNCPVKLRYPFTYGHVDFDLKNNLKVSGNAKNLARGSFAYATNHQDKYTKLQITAKSDFDFSDAGDDKLKYFIKQVMPSLELSLELNKIREWLSSLPEKYTVLPAPLNSMNGAIVLTVEKSADLHKMAKLTFDLKDKIQRINFDLVTHADFSRSVRSPALDVDFTLRNLALRLPRWNFRDPKPTLFNDGRFQDGKPAATATNAPANSLPLKIKTEVLNPIRISTNLLKEQLRILLDLDWKNGAISKVDVTLLPLKAEFLRRNFEIQSVHFQSDGGKTSSLITAEVKFLLPDYVVTAKVEGTTEQPVVNLSSNPPLAENDIYSVLVFGKPMNGLQTEQQSSLAAARQTFATGLFSLTSLYFLGSTPIESIYFDPETGEATARVRLDSKSSVSVGADTSDVNRVEVRRSLGKGWYIQGGVKDLDQSEENYGASVEKVISY